MRPTRWSVLLIVAVGAAAVAYAVTRSSYDTLPQPGVAATAWAAVLAIAELYLALSTRARLAGRPGTRPIDPLLVARFVALAKASSIVGALAFGGYAGYLVWVAKLDSPTGQHDTAVAAVAVAMAVLLVAAALFLEHVCRIRTPKDNRPVARDEADGTTQ
jgi:uncharacterized membrane protein YbhN (UPF0104 family)